MKHLFLLLLAVNLGLFIWGYQRERAAEHSKPHARADVGNLRLLTEQKAISEPEPMPELAYTTEKETEDLMAGTTAESDSIVSTPEQVDKAQQDLSEEEMQEDVQLAQQVEDELSQNMEQEPQTEISEVSEAPADDAEDYNEGHLTQVSEEQLSEEVEQDQMAVTELQAEIEQETYGEQESQVEQEAQAAEEMQVTEEMPVEQETQADIAAELEQQLPELACYQLGPISDPSSIEGVSSHLVQLGYDPEENKQTIKKLKSYWVMVPAQETYMEGRQKLKELQAAGISDLWLFPKGEYKNAISLGLYARRSNADAAQERALKKGVSTEVQPYYVDADQYWLKFQSAERPPIAEESRLALQEAYPDEEFSIQPCSTVVTE